MPTSFRFGWLFSTLSSINHRLQIIDGLQGAYDAEVFDILGTTYLAISEHVSNANCGPNGLGDSSLTPSCQNVAINSRVFVFDPSVPNPRGDCPPSSSNAVVPNCQTFAGEFVLLQSLPTSAARSMHYFTVSTSETTYRFLAVAEHRDNKLLPVNSSIWLWNGHEFGHFQDIVTDYATRFTSFTLNTDTFLAVANRGCPEIERESDGASFARCDRSSEIGRTRIWMFDTKVNQFVLVPETVTLGTLHPFGADSQAAGSDGSLESLLLGFSGVPHGIESFQLPDFSILTGFSSTPTQYLAVANYRFDQTTTNGPSFFPKNIFSVNFAVTEA